MAGWSIRDADDDLDLQRGLQELAETGEQWKVIEGSDLCGVSDHGRVFSVRTRTMLRPGRTQSGHLQVSILIDGRRRSASVHRLVALAFVPNTHGYPLVRHLDDVKEHNVPANLAWGTTEDNENDFIRNSWLRTLARVRQFGVNSRPGHPRYVPPWARLQVVTLPQEAYRPSLSDPWRRT